MQSSKLEMGYNENNETNLCQISSVREFGFCAERDLHDGCPYYASASWP